MDIIIEKSVLVNALQLITPITDKSSSKPILSNFVLKTGGTEGGEGLAEFSATDYEIAVQGRVAAQVKEPGSVCISAKKMLETCREFMAETIHIRSDPQLWVTVEGGSSRLRLPSVEIGLYPQMEQTELPHRFQIAGKDLKRCIDLTIFAAQTNEARKNLMGVALNVGTGSPARWTATDGHRLAQVKRELALTSPGSPPEIIIPRKSLVEMQKVLGGEGQVTVSFDDRALLLTADGVSVLTRLIEGKFPNIDPIIPHDSDKSATLDRERLITALKIISTMSSDKIKPVKLSFLKEKLRLESEQAEYGNAYDEFSIEYEGEELAIGFNAKYLLDVLTVASHGRAIRMDMKGALNPCLMSLLDDPSFLAVVMPLKIEW